MPACLTTFRRLPLAGLLLAGLLLATLLWPAAAHALTDAEFDQMLAAPAGQTAAGAPAQQPLAPAHAPATATQSVGVLAARLAVALGLVFAIMFAVVWAAKRYFPKTSQALSGGAIEIVATRQLGQRRSLLLVRTRGRTLLLGATPGTISLLSDLDEPAAWDHAAQAAGLDAEVRP